MSTGFVHSIKVPRFYKTTANIVKSVREEGASLKQLLYQKKHPNIKGIYALALSTLQHGAQLDMLIRKTRILLNEQRLDPWLARVLIAELLWGKQILHSECKPIQTVLSYEKQLREEAKLVPNMDVKTYMKKVEKPRYIRINTLKTTVEQAISSLEREGWYYTTVNKNYLQFLDALKNLNENSFLQDIHVPELLVFPPGTQFHNYDAYKNGTIILQDKASCLPAFLLNAAPGSVVLDMCAAPGMKTTHLAAKMKNKGKIYSVEMDSRRYDTLCEFVKMTESICVETIKVDAMTLNDTKCPDVEYILTDPSCSGSGMLDRIDFDDSQKRCPPARIKSLQSFQVLLLRHALLGFSYVKRVVYSTCSLYPEENEEVIDEILSDVGDSYKLLTAKDLLDGNWINTSSMNYVCGGKCLYAKPEVDMTNGFFVAIFERNPSVPLPDYKRKGKGLKKQRDQNHSDHNMSNDNCPPKKKRRKKRQSKAAENKNISQKNEEEVNFEKNDINNIDENLSKKRHKKKKKDKKEASFNQNENEVTENHEKSKEHENRKY